MPLKTSTFSSKAVLYQLCSCGGKGLMNDKENDIMNKIVNDKGHNFVS